jgi:hypothetical protein
MKLWVIRRFRKQILKKNENIYYLAKNFQVSGMSKSLYNLVPFVVFKDSMPSLCLLVKYDSHKKIWRCNYSGMNLSGLPWKPSTIVDVTITIVCLPITSSLKEWANSPHNVILILWSLQYFVSHQIIIILSRKTIFKKIKQYAVLPRYEKFNPANVSLSWIRCVLQYCSRFYLFNFCQ